MLMGVIYYSERISAKGKCTRGKVHRRPDTSFQESFPSRSHGCSWFPQQLYKMLSSRKCIRNRKFQSAPHFSWALVMKAPYSHIYLNSRLLEGKWVFSMNHVFCTKSLKSRSAASRRKGRPCYLGNRIQSISQSKRRDLRQH